MQNNDVFFATESCTFSERNQSTLLNTLAYILMCHAKHARGGAQPVSLRFIRRKRERARTRAARAVSPYFKMAPRVTRVFVFLRRYIFFFFPERLLAFPASDCDGTQMCFPFPPAARAPPGGVSGQRGEAAVAECRPPPGLPLARAAFRSTAAC